MASICEIQKSKTGGIIIFVEFLLICFFCFLISNRKSVKCAIFIFLYKLNVVKQFRKSERISSPARPFSE